MKKSSRKKVILTTLLAFIVSLIVFVGAVFVWFQFLADNDQLKPSNAIAEDDQKELLGGNLAVPRKTNFLLIGVDQSEFLSDVIIVGSFDSKTEKITLISIPRDTYVTVSDELRAEMRADGIRLPSHPKINEVSSYAGGGDKGTYYIEKYLEELMGIEIDYYAKVNTKAFRDIVDAVGGIDMEIRPEGLHYYDPTQDLTIDVPGGMQHLDGAMAEGVVRYRHDYAMGDLDRIDVQHDFLKEFFNQVLNKDVLTKNGLEIFKTCLEYTTTNLPFSEAVKYFQFVPDLDENSLVITTAPGYSQTISGVSYYIINEEELQQLVNTVFYGDGISPVTPQLAGKSIQILNGSGIEALGEDKEQIMSIAGYNVEDVSDYTGTPENFTKIYTKPGIDASELDYYFNTPTYEVNEEITGEYDVVIVIGVH